MHFARPTLILADTIPFKKYRFFAIMTFDI